MKTGVTNTISEIIQYEYVGGPKCKPVIRTQYQTNGTFVDFDNDITRRSIELSNDNDQYQVYSFLPPVKKMSMAMNNYEQRYSPLNTASDLSTVLRKGLSVRCWSGFELTIAAATGTDYDTFTFGKKVHTQEIGGKLYADDTSYSGTYDESMLGAAYDSTLYGATTYAYAGYYSTAFVLPDVRPKATAIRVTTSSNNMFLKYRTARSSAFLCTDWVTASLATGDNTIPLSIPINHRHIQANIIFDVNTWNTADYISTLGIDFNQYAQYFKMGTFIIDDPVFTNENISIKGRDPLKKALETEMNLPRFTNIPVTDAIPLVLDRCGIQYSTAEWDLISTTISLDASAAEDLEDLTGWKLLDKMMDAANAGDDDIRFLFDEDGKAQVRKIPTDIEADWNIHYFYNTEQISRSSDSRKQVQRITASKNNLSVGSEVTIANFTGTISGSGNTAYVTFAYPTFAKYDASSKLTTGTGVSALSDAVYVRYTDAAGNLVEEDNRTTDSIRLGFNVSGGVTAYDFTVYGCGKKRKTGFIYAERGNANNILNNSGSTFKVKNELMDADMLKAFCDYHIVKGGNPKETVTASMVGNPFMQLNDNIVILDNYLYDDRVFGIVGIDESWSNPGLTHKYKLRNKDFTLGAFIWDRNGDDEDNIPAPGINDLQYDKGFVWDQDLKVGGSDLSTYKKRNIFS